MTSLQINIRYLLRLVENDSGRGFYVEAYQESNSAVRGSLAQWMPTGKSWRFHHWLWRGNAYLDDYREFNTTGMTWTPDERLIFAYDHLDRLLSAAPESGAQGYSQAFQYNAIGNLTSFAGTAYAYNDAAHKHAVTHLGGVQKYWYDANGSMTTRIENGVTYQQAWDVENRLTSVSGNGTTTFTYDGDGARVKKVNASGTTVYVGAAEVLINATQRITRTYYAAGTQLVAMRVVTSTGGNTLYYLHTDHLGSASLTTNSSGGEAARQNYYPYGAIRSGGGMPTDIGFTGQRLDSYTGGLMFYNARYYSPSLNRWIQPDTIVPDPANPQSLNRYSYVNNNPLKYIDPSGHCFIFCIAAIGAAIGAVVNAVAYTVQVASTGQPWDAGAFVGAVATGAAAGAVAAVSIVVEPIDYALTAVQCVTAGCSIADVALTVVPGAIGPIARQVDNVLDIARAAENTSDAVKAVENAQDTMRTAENAADTVSDICSFSADTLVAAEDGEKTIETLEVGDRVLAYDEALGFTGLYTVTAVWAHTDAQIVYLTINGEQIETTAEHPFLTWAGDWVPAGELWVGAQVRNAEGEYGEVQLVEVAHRPQLMYNLTVAQAHTFFVGDGQWLVHNACRNPYGRRGDPIRHQGRVQDAEQQLGKRGWNTESGGSKPERAVDIPGGGKRYPDLVMERNGQRVAVQVGDVTKAGQPVARELRALQDLRSTGKFKHVWFLKKK